MLDDFSALIIIIIFFFFQLVYKLTLKIMQHDFTLVLLCFIFNDPQEKQDEVRNMLNVFEGEVYCL